MARPPRAQGDTSTEQAILDSAEQLFLNKGFEQTSTTEIARQAGCNQALVHYYFRTKEQLFVSVFQKKVNVFITKFLAVYRQGIPFEEKIGGIVDAHFDILLRNPKLPNLIINELATNPRRVKRMREGIGELPLSLFTQLGADLRVEIAAGRVRHMEPIDLIMDILSLDAFPFLASSILKNAIGMRETEYRKFVNRRRESVKQTLLNSLRP